MQVIDFDAVKRRVNEWAKDNARTEWSYNAPYVWWGMARAAGVIDEGELAHARRSYGNLWNYVGD